MTYVYIGKNSANRDVYRITLALFQDCKNGNPDVISKDNPAYFSFFRKSNSKYLGNKKVSSNTPAEAISYGVNPICFDNLPNLCLQKTSFTFEFELPSPSSPNFDPEGYVIAYQRCCRNNVISNVVNPERVGTTLFTYIPSSTLAYNNSPTHNDPPLVICNNYPQRIDYRSLDQDGDSLVYYLCSSYIGASNDDTNPTVTSPPPFGKLNYKAPYSEFTPFPSSSPVYIDPHTGILEFTPTKLGIYTVVVCIDEYRDGVKIGEHHRETQFYVTPCSKISFASMPVLDEDPSVHQIVCNGYTVLFRNNSRGATNYFWDFGDPNTLADTSHSISPTYTYPDTGVYQVTLITDRNLECSDSVMKLVKLYPYFSTHFSYDGIYCPGEAITFEDSSFTTFGHTDSWSWSFDDGSYAYDSVVTHSYDNVTNTYHVVLISKNSMGCVDSASADIQIYDVDLFAGNDTVVVKNNYVQLGSRAESSVTWTPDLYMDDPHSTNPVFYFPNTGQYTYYVHTTNELGCEATDTVNIVVTDKPYFFIPTAFTPNGDGRNDVIKILPSGIKELVTFRIYNRYGEEVFNTIHIKDYWDGVHRGSPLPVGVYYWYAIGVDLNDKEVVNKGDITLIR